METCIFIPDSGDVKFADLILDDKKHGETRKRIVHLPIGKWIGIARNKMVIGEVVFGTPVVIDRSSSLYGDACIAGTKYDIGDGETKLYYPIMERRDMRHDPKPVLRFGALYGKYEKGE